MVISRTNRRGSPSTNTWNLGRRTVRPEAGVGLTMTEGPGLANDELRGYEVPLAPRSDAAVGEADERRSAVGGTIDDEYIRGLEECLEGGPIYRVYLDLDGTVTPDPEAAQVEHRGVGVRDVPNRVEGLGGVDLCHHVIHPRRAVYTGERILCHYRMPPGRMRLSGFGARRSASSRTSIIAATARSVV